MGRKHITKKRTVRKHISKNKTKDKTKEDAEKLKAAVNGNMSKLEYEKLMMDPRFKAAMMGFNNPTLNASQYMNQAKREQETKNNELTRQIVYLNDINNLNKTKQKLKDEIAQTKLQHQQEKAEMLLNSEKAIKEKEFEMLKNKNEYDKQITALNTNIAQQKQTMEEQQARYKQEQERTKAEYDLLIKQLQKQHQDDLQPIKEATEQIKREFDINQQLINQDKELRQAEQEKLRTEIAKHYQDVIEPIKEQTEAINNLALFEKERHSHIKELNDAKTAQMIAEFKSQTQPLIYTLRDKASDLTDKLKVLDTKIQTIQEIKKAKLELDQTQIQSISQPIIQKLEIKTQELQGQLAINKDIFNEIKKQNDLKIKIAQQEQVVDPTVRDEYNKKLAEEKSKTYKLELTKKQSDEVMKARAENEALKKDIISNCAKLYTDFDLKYLDDPDFNKKLSDKEMKYRNEYVKYFRNLEHTKRAIDAEKKLEDIKYKYAEKQAELSAISGESSQYAATINKAAETKIKLQNDINRYKKAIDELHYMKNDKQKFIEAGLIELNQFMDRYPIVKETAKEIAQQRHGTPDIQFDDIIPTINAAHANATKLLDDISKLPKGVNPSLDQDIADLAEKVKNYDIESKRENINVQLEALKTQNVQLHGEIDDWQQRHKQLALLTHGLRQTLTKENITLNHTYGDYARSLNINIPPDDFINKEAAPYLPPKQSNTPNINNNDYNKVSNYEVDDDYNNN